MKKWLYTFLWQEWPDLRRFNDLFLLILRCWLAWVFFRAGWVKWQSWDTTVALFEYEYAVPLLSPMLAAVLATVIELGVPFLLALGFLVRPASAILLVFNFIAMNSYPDISAAGIKEHELWQLAMAVVLLGGAGNYSVTHTFRNRYLNMANDPA